MSHGKRLKKTINVVFDSIWSGSESQNAGLSEGNGEKRLGKVTEYFRMLHQLTRMSFESSRASTDDVPVTKPEIASQGILLEISTAEAKELARKDKDGLQLPTPAYPVLFEIGRGYEHFAV